MPLYSLGEKDLQFKKDVNFPREWLFKFDNGVLLLGAKHRRWHNHAVERMRRRLMAVTLQSRNAPRYLGISVIFLKVYSAIEVVGDSRSRLCVGGSSTRLYKSRVV